MVMVVVIIVGVGDCQGIGVVVVCLVVQCDLYVFIVGCMEVKFEVLMVEIVQYGGMVMVVVLDSILVVDIECLFVMVDKIGLVLLLVVYNIGCNIFVLFLESQLVDEYGYWCCCVYGVFLVSQQVLCC